MDIPVAHILITELEDTVDISSNGNETNKILSERIYNLENSLSMKQDEIQKKELEIERLISSYLPIFGQKFFDM